ncbi:MAG TPA: LysM peptidoglycan-binding domain-containing protein [Bacteroidota bacterium]|nr:LysM peptidoglycan-binding domain-containing protein [Bacteroidota bacterium]
MKLKILSLCAFLLIAATSASSQEKLSKEEWQKQITEYTSQRDSLKNELGTLTKQIDALRSALASLDKQIQTVKDETLALSGASDAVRTDFERRLQDLERRVAELLTLSDQDLYAHRSDVDSAQAIKDNLMKERLADVERYYERLQKVQSKIDNLRSTLAKVASAAESEEHYVVRSWSKYRDCLWNISKKKKIYDSPFLWPKIWQANRDRIKDPDIIHVGQRLMIPPPGSLTTAEKSAERVYWSKKHA